MKTFKRLSVPRLLTPVALAMTLAACSSTPSSPTGTDITAEPAFNTQTYLMRADSSEGEVQGNWMILALKAAVEEGDQAQAQLLIQRIAKMQLTPSQNAEWRLTQAQLLMDNEQFEDALKVLEFPYQWSLPVIQWQNYHQMRADIFTALDRHFESSRELVALYDFVSDSEKEALADQIWTSLNHYSATDFKSMRIGNNETILQGWIQLANDVKSQSSNLSGLKSTLEQWLAANPNHPAAIYTPQAIQDILALKIVKPVNTALLLPLTGQFAKQAQLIRDGFVLAMMNDPHRDANATLTIIDTNAETAQSVDATLTAKNIDFVVGPLIKENIDKLHESQNKRGQSIPMLALNIPDQVEPGYATCYLALSPEQEAEQAAKHLYQKGYQYPLVLAPNNSYGKRVSAAFQNAWKQLSDHKVALNLFGDKRQLQRNINSVFGLQDSQQNITQMQSLLGMNMESQPRSRRDVDAVYIIANSAELTLIKPFIEVAINPDTLPPKLFASSRSNTSRRQYEDLTGVAYSDIPLLIHPDPELVAEMNQMWPKDSNAERRLQALGMDAYKLVGELPQMKAITGYTVAGQTGELSVDSDCVVQRELSWSEHEAQ